MLASTMTSLQCSAHSLLEKVDHLMLNLVTTEHKFHPGTLLNRLFGTSFDVMDETKRQQTTKGDLIFTTPAC